ncbi:zgc:172076 isoform X3 [Betta splendens]|uniref:creatine kinase n=1 Tax=Betta splendens TaxID=158456 RepID=A0A9W2Y322_BETSP|nr:zgc:172076 isoform X3 [Betta splendens]
MWKVKPPAEFPMEMRYRSILEGLAPPDPLAQFHLRRGSPEEEFPDLSRNYTWMGRILTPAMYRRQFNRCTSSGVVFDDVIRPGLEEPGQRSGPVSVGCAAGDAQSYILFCDFFDRVIEAHHEHKISSETPESDLNYANLKGSDDLDGSYAVGCELSVVRGVEDFCFPPHCSRGERRQLLALARRALQRLEDHLPGRLLVLEQLNQEQRRELGLSAPSPAQLRTGLARDWPDSRAESRRQLGDLGQHGRAPEARVHTRRRQRGRSLEMHLHEPAEAGDVLSGAQTPVHLEAAARMVDQFPGRRGNRSEGQRPPQAAAPSQTQTPPGHPEETEDPHGQDRNPSDVLRHKRCDLRPERSGPDAACGGWCQTAGCHGDKAGREPGHRRAHPSAEVDSHIKPL